MDPLRNKLDTLRQNVTINKNILEVRNYHKEMQLTLPHKTLQKSLIKQPNRNANQLESVWAKSDRKNWNSICLQEVAVARCRLKV